RAHRLQLGFYKDCMQNKRFHCRQPFLYYLVIIQEWLPAVKSLVLHTIIPVLFGDNLGTTITAILASIGASVAARRAALTHVIFNVIGASIFIVLLQLFIKYVAFLQSSLNLNPEMTLAFAHGSYNIANTAIQFPFIGLLAWMVTKAIP